MGCTLVVTQNYLVTLREDFTAPLKQWQMINKTPTRAKINLNEGGQGCKNTSLLNSNKGRLELDHFNTNSGSLVSNVKLFIL